MNKATLYFLTLMTALYSYGDRYTINNNGSMEKVKVKTSSYEDTTFIIKNRNQKKITYVNMPNKFFDEHTLVDYISIGNDSFSRNELSDTLFIEGDKDYMNIRSLIQQQEREKAQAEKSAEDAKYSQRVQSALKTLRE